MTENEYDEMLKENALKITDETMLEKAHEIARHNYLCGKREALEVIEDIKAEIAEYKDDKVIHAESNEMIDIVLEIIDRHCGKEHE